jgi:hypothetical protein
MQRLLLLTELERTKSLKGDKKSMEIICSLVCHKKFISIERLFILLGTSEKCS